MIFRSDPTSLPALAALAIGLFALAVRFAFARRNIAPAWTGLALLGIGVQAVAIGIAAYGAPHVALDPRGADALIRSVVIAILLTAVLVGSVRFRRVRYAGEVGIALFTVALALACGHLMHLTLALPLLVIGTWLRSRVARPAVSPLPGRSAV